MRILADENIPRSVVEALRGEGHDILWVTEESPGISDLTVISLANAGQRLLLTFDRDFGELIFRQQIRPPSGIILLRVPLLLPAPLASLITHALSTRDDWDQHFSVIEEKSIRMTPLACIRELREPEI